MNSFIGFLAFLGLSLCLVLLLLHSNAVNGEASLSHRETNKNLSEKVGEVGVNVKLPANCQDNIGTCVPYKCHLKSAPYVCCATCASANPNFRVPANDDGRCVDKIGTCRPHLCYLRSSPFVCCETCGFGG